MTKTRRRPTKPTPSTKPVPEPERSSRRPSARVAVFIGVLVACIVGGLAYVVIARNRVEDAEANAPKVETAGKGALTTYRDEPHVLFRSTGLGRGYGEVAVTPLATPKIARALTSLSCERVAYAAGRGICLTADRGAITTYGADIFDSKFRVTRHLAIQGLPSRTRVAPNGKLAAWTVFVTGDSYASNNFSTRTSFVNLRTGEVLPDLEKFKVTRDGDVVDAIDRNFWGVTFAPDSDKFYATLSTGGNTYLIQGRVSTQSAKVIHDGVECPSLSPDGTRIAYKKRTGNFPVQWRVHVLDLATGKETATAETRNVDDQVEWLDNAHVLYGLPDANSATASTSIWTVPADGTGTPKVFIPRAWSPAIITN
jgi:hypothetical protein